MMILNVEDALEEAEGVHVKTSVGLVGTLEDATEPFIDLQIRDNDNRVLLTLSVGACEEVAHQMMRAVARAVAVSDIVVTLRAAGFTPQQIEQAMNDKGEV